MLRNFFVCLALVATMHTAGADETGSIFSREIRQEAQQALIYYGFDAGVADGVFGRQTRAAIAAYQTYIGGQQTGELSRAGMSQLLQSYREDRRRDAARVAETGLPLPVAAAILAMARPCGTTEEALVAQQGFLQSYDLNNDGIVNYLIDGSAANCSELCGAAICQVTLLVSTSRGFLQSDFLGAGVTPQTFNCLSNGYCEFAR